MKLATLAMIGAVSVAVMGTGTGTANATPFAPDVTAQVTSDIVQVRGGCGPGWRPTRRGCVRDHRQHHWWLRQ
jgi:hypothetical protein